MGGGGGEEIEYYTRTRWRRFILQLVVSKRIYTTHCKINRLQRVLVYYSLYYSY